MTPIWFTNPRRFFFHYNKGATQQAGETRMTVHMGNACYVARRVECQVPIETKENKAQPYLVLRGKARKLTLEGDTLIISN